MKGRVYPTVPGLRVSLWFQFSDFTKEINIKIARKTHFMLQIFQVFLENTFFQMVKIQHQKIIITAWVSK
jgi:hypothetical protein